MEGNILNMAVTVIGLLRFGFSLVFGITVTVIFSLYYKRPWLISAVSVLSGYLCCQAPRWISFLAGAVLGSNLADHVIYIGAIFLFYYFLKRYVSGSVRQVIEVSIRSCLFLGGVPLFYYLFDYTTTIYTDIFYSGTKWAVQFMPSTVSIFYFVFVILYYTETQNQAALQGERNMLDVQFKQAQAEFSTLRQMQQNAASYRHDMRHHFSLLQGMASNGHLEEIKEYLQTAQSDMDAITPIRVCENETVNLILSAFAGKAKQMDIRLSIEAKLPDTLPFSDTELCSLLSNALENSFHACEQLADSNKRIIRLRMYSKNTKLCIDICNSYQYELIFHQGLPVSTEQGHGFGTKSMVHIVEKHGGVYQFSVKNGWFILQATA